LRLLRLPIKVSVSMIHFMRKDQALTAVLTSVLILAGCGSTAKPEQSATTVTSHAASVVVKSACSLPGLQVSAGTEYGGESFFETLLVSNTSGRPIRIGGFPKITVFSAAADSSTPEREPITVSRRGRNREPLTMEGGESRYQAGAQLDLRLGAPIANGTAVRTVQVVGVQVAFRTEQCTLGLDPSATQVEVAQHQRMPVTTTSLALVTPSAVPS
jgi:hypothetical protein